MMITHFCVVHLSSQQSLTLTLFTLCFLLSFLCSLLSWLILVYNSASYLLLSLSLMTLFLSIISHHISSSLLLMSCCLLFWRRIVHQIYWCMQRVRKRLNTLYEWSWVQSDWLSLVTVTVSQLVCCVYKSENTFSALTALSQYDSELMSCLLNIYTDSLNMSINSLDSLSSTVAD